MASWITAGLGLLLAVIALVSVRRLSRKLESLNQSYWELRYDYTRLRSQLARLDPEEPVDPPVAPSPEASVSFVPLSTIRKKAK